jgi:hypothetical protein
MFPMGTSKVQIPPPPTIELSKQNKKENFASLIPPSSQKPPTDSYFDTRRESNISKHAVCRQGY